METAILYTFSTIPQVLAVAIGMLGIFALLKIQNLNAALAYSRLPCVCLATFSYCGRH